MASLYQKTEQFVIGAFTEVKKESLIKHLQRTAYWAKKLNPNADEALLIAAIAHDIERAYEKNSPEEKKGFDYTNTAILRQHEKKGAKIMENFLKSQNADQQLIKKVKMLISRHEEGGNKEQNLLKDADSLSFFENNIPLFLEKAKKSSKEKIRKKFDWMFKRITLPKAKKIAQPWYKEAKKALEKI